jgi:predicted component of viral defense system (DUF524 family)
MLSEESHPGRSPTKRVAIGLASEAAPYFIYDDHILPDDETVILYNPSSKPAAILPVPEAYQPALGRVAIFEWTEYLLKGKGLQAVKLGSTSPSRLDDDLYSFEVKNQVGRLRLTLNVNGNRYELPLAVLSRKYPKPREHLDFFGALLDDLIELSAALPFHVAHPTAFAADESPEPPTVLFVYHFLRQYNLEIQSALETILGNPHRTLIFDDDVVPLAQATHADAAVLDAILTQPQLLTRTREKLPVAQALRNHAPTHLWQPRAEETFDTPPNRFARQFLIELADWNARLGEESWLVAHLGELERVRDQLTFAQYDPLWDEVGLLTRFPAENQVLLKRYGYREWADLWRRFHLARLPVWRQTQEAIDTRDIATLYEIWCFFALVDKIGDTLGVSPEERQWKIEVSDERGLVHKSRVTFGQTGYRLTYNEGFGRGKKRSYSVMLRPDFTLHGPSELRLVFDAKFRFDETTFEVADEDDGDDLQRVAKKADLYKMHTYRDALNAQAAITLYPGDMNTFYHADANCTESVNWSALLTGAWSGIGAVAMAP